MPKPRASAVYTIKTGLTADPFLVEIHVVDPSANLRTRCGLEVKAVWYTVHVKDLPEDGVYCYQCLWQLGEEILAAWQLIGGDYDGVRRPQL